MSKKQRKRIRALADKWLQPLGLLWWGIEFRHIKDRAGFKRDNGNEALMIVYADWRYMKAVVEVNTEMMKDIDDDELELSFLHEMCHIILDEMDCPDKDHEERVATTMAHAFRWVRGADVRASD